MIKRKNLATSLFKGCLILVILLLVVFVSVLILKSHSIANAQAPSQELKDLIGNAVTPIVGEWQKESFNNSGYRLWSYKDYGVAEVSWHPKVQKTYIGTNGDGIYCATYTQYVQVPVNFYDDIQIDPDTPLQQQQQDSPIDQPILGYAVAVEDTDTITIPQTLPECYGIDELNQSRLEDNLNSDRDFLDGKMAIDWKYYNPRDWRGVSKKTVLEDQKGFLVVGDDHGNPYGFTNKKLEFDLWIPDQPSVDITDLELITDNFCDSSDWDNGGHLGHTTLSLSGKKGSKQITSSEVSCAEITHRIPGNIVRTIGEPFDHRSLVSINQSQEVVDQLYKSYKITVEFKSATGSNVEKQYANQFKLAIDKPSGSYMGIGETQQSGDNLNYKADSALSVSNRLPERYDSLEIFWKTTIYMAADPEQGCLGEETKKIGLYDSDYPDTEVWGEYIGRMNPRIKITSVDRNDFLSGRASSFNPERWLDFDGLQGIKKVSQDAWEYADHTFDFSKIYKLEFFNIDQRTWIQVGLPYNQINALQKCVYKPYVKVGHSGISVGGRFGLNDKLKACEGMDLNVTANLYAHANKSGGSSAQYEVIVRDEIAGFYSNYGLNKDPPPNSYKDLTFANDANDKWGGNFDDLGRCMPNYWRGVQSLKADTATTRLNIADAGKVKNDARQLFKPAGGELRLENIDVNSTLPAPNTSDLGLRSTIYIEGDLIIENDILNNNSLSFEKFNEVGHLYIIVKGDIFIEPNVTQIDSILVAYTDDPNPNPNPNVGGRIFTCNFDTVQNINLESLEDLAANELLNELLIAESLRYNSECQQKLVVNGALIGREIHLGRIFDTTAIKPDPVAEEINLSPEYFVGTPQLPEFSEWIYTSDSVTILPANF